jgi:hypothetical protein
MQQEKSFSLLEAEIARVTVENGELKQHLSDTNDLSQHTVDVISVGAGKDGKSVVPNGMDGAISVENLKNEGELPSGVVHSFFYRQSSVLGHFIGIIVVELKNEMKSQMAALQSVGECSAIRCHSFIMLSIRRNSLLVHPSVF